MLCNHLLPATSTRVVSPTCMCVAKLKSFSIINIRSSALHLCFAGNIRSMSSFGQHSVIALTHCCFPSSCFRIVLRLAVRANLRTGYAMVKRHNDMRQYMDSFVDECFDAMTTLEDDMLKRKIERRRGKSVTLASVCTGGGFGDEATKAYPNLSFQ